MVAGYGNSSAGSDPMALNGPLGIYITESNDLYVAEYNGQRVRCFPNGSRDGMVVAATGTIGSSPTTFNYPSAVFVDEATQGIYVSDMRNQRIQWFPPTSTVGTTVAGDNGDLGDTYGVQLDNHGNIYASDASFSRVMRWPLNSTANGTVVAGGSKGFGSSSLNFSRQIAFDGTYSFLYVVDKLNHRIQMYNLVNTSTTPITVAGGNGPGTAPNQLNKPDAACVSRKTGTLYIADTDNHRVQRWSFGSSAGVTIAGSINGLSGSSATLLRYPAGIMLDANETFLYVAEWRNHRVRRLTLI